MFCFLVLNWKRKTLLLIVPISLHVYIYIFFLLWMWRTALRCTRQSWEGRGWAGGRGGVWGHPGHTQICIFASVWCHTCPEDLNTAVDFFTLPAHCHVHFHFTHCSSFFPPRPTNSVMHADAIFYMHIFLAQKSPTIYKSLNNVFKRIEEVG